MKEYTILAAISVIVTCYMDKKLDTKLLKNGLFYLFIVIIFGFKLLVNGFLTGEGIVLYNPDFFLGVRITSIPLEDFLFGFSMVTMNVIFWEKLKKE